MLFDKQTAKQEKILASLNPMQKKAAIHKEGPLVVFAGAGSGKTRIITARICLLLESGVLPEKIIAVTFTKKAAKEMQERVLAQSSLAKRVVIGTFHSVCARWLREFSEHLAYQSYFAIYDEKDSLSALKTTLEGLNILGPNASHSPQDYQRAIAKAKIHAWFPKDIIAVQQRSSYAWMPPAFYEVYKAYQEYLAACQAMDFSDLILNLTHLLQTDPLVQEALHKRCQYVLVDEYQDTNPAQFALINALTARHKNLFVVGDDDQSIYSWRGAEPKNIIQFETYFPGACHVHLEQNYRCTGNIVKAANAVIAKNEKRVKKALWTKSPAGEPIDFILSYDGEGEALGLADLIARERQEYPYDEVAIFYRMNAQSRLIEEYLRRSNVPYRIYGSLEFFSRAEIKDLIAYLRLLYNEQDNVAFLRIINLPPRGLGKTALKKIADKSKEDSSSYLQATRKIALETSGRSSLRLKEFVVLMDELYKALQTCSLSGVLSELLTKIEYQAYLEKKYPEQVLDKQANIHELGAALSDYDEQHEGATTVTQWLQDISLVETRSSEGEEASLGEVSLMTLHAAKGLEFSRTYILGVEEGLLPHSNNMEDPDKLEEERRLLYVGITRTKKKLSLMAARKRRVFNQWMANPPSRFLQEIPRTVMAEAQTKSLHKSAFRNQATCKNLSQGTAVRHPAYGAGVVQGVKEDSFGDTLMTVDFRDFGLRSLPSSHLKRISQI